MGSLILGITMFICIVPLIWVIYLYMYPRKWEKGKMIFGIKNRDEFLADDVKESVEKTVVKRNKEGLYISLGCTLLAVILLLLHGMKMQTFIWCIFIFAVIFIIEVPYILGHKEMLAIKRSFGIGGDKKVNVVDLKAAGSIHALKIEKVIFPTVVAFLGFMFFLLLDMGVISIAAYKAAGSFLGTAIGGTLFGTGLLFVFVSVLMDNVKNEVISYDSDINANYNRAKKKLWADLSVLFLWINTFYLLLGVGGMLFINSGAVIFGGIVVYMVLLMAGIIIFASANSRVDDIYKKSTDIIVDDDEYWLGGIIYCNPADKRVNIEKRAGFGVTINVGHPVGMIIGITCALVIVASLLSVVWVGMIEITPISVSIEDGSVVCHQLRNEYVIPIDSIKSVEFGEDIHDHDVLRSSGVGMDTLLKGNFIVDGKNGCKLFLNPTEKVFIRIETTDGQIYYIGGTTAEETEQIYEMLK